MDVASRYGDEDEGEVVDNMLACWLVLGNSAGLQGVRGRLLGRVCLGNEVGLAKEERVPSIRRRVSSLHLLLGDSSLRKGLIPKGFLKNPKPEVTGPSLLQCCISKLATRSSTLCLLVHFLVNIPVFLSFIFSHLPLTD